MAAQVGHVPIWGECSRGYNDLESQVRRVQGDTRWTRHFVEVTSLT